LEAYAKRENAKELTFTTAILKNFLQDVRVNYIAKRKVFYILSGVLVAFCLLGLEPHVFGK
jgi:SecD/SecF fusion protein